MKPPKKPKPKKDYTKPRIVYSEKLEAFAVLCTTGKSDPGTCPQGPISS